MCLGEVHKFFDKSLTSQCIGGLNSYYYYYCVSDLTHHQALGDGAFDFRFEDSSLLDSLMQVIIIIIIQKRGGNTTTILLLIMIMIQ